VSGRNLSDRLPRRKDAATIIALRPRLPGDAERLWREFCALRKGLLDEIDKGIANMETICRCADAYRAWQRAYAWNLLA
jgi:hypothetical protein